MSDTPQGSRVGSQFGPYHLKRLLGRGGMGEVYEAEHTVKEWTVALKLLSEKFSQDPVFRKRMQREARTAGRLQEPHVVPIHDYGEIDGQLYLEMRLIEGTDLSAQLKRFGPLTPPRAVAIVRQVAAALDAAHAAGVMHRDVKPANVLITRDDFAYLVDFGIASATTDERLTQLGTAMGTWKYMAPERFSDDEVTYRADIYALACVLHECLTGSPPYRADSMGALITAHMHQPIPRPSQVRPGVPAAFDEVITRGMAKRPEDRYASAGDLALAAHQALSTVDQDQAATLLRRSQEAVLPAADVAAVLPAPTPPPHTPYPGPGDSGRLPRPAPAPSPGERASWAPESGPIHTPAGGQPAASPQFFQGSGAWSGSAPWNLPPLQHPGVLPPGTQPALTSRRSRPGILIGAAAVAVLVVAAVVVAVIWFSRPQPQPDESAVRVTEVDDGVLVGSPAAATTIDVFDEPICPPCGRFETRSSTDIELAVNTHKIAVRYHLLNFLDENSASGDYSTRAAAASYCVAATKDPKAYQAFYAGIFASDFQPKEKASGDRTNDELAKLAQTVGAPASAVSCIQSGQSLATAKAKAKRGLTSLQGLTAQVSTPQVFSGTKAVNVTEPGWVDALS